MCRSCGRPGFFDKTPGGPVGGFALLRPRPVTGKFHQVGLGQKRGQPLLLCGAELAVAGGGGQEFFGRHLGRSEIEAVFQILPHDGGQTHVIRLKLLLFNQTLGVQSAQGLPGRLGKRAERVEPRLERDA